jgi:hypothetical protein
MNKHLFALGLVVFAASFATVGCADSDDQNNGGAVEGEEDDLTARQLPGVAGVEIQDVRGAQEVQMLPIMIGAPKKVKALVASVKKLRPSDPVPRCMSRNTTRLSFFNDTGKKIATVSTYCAGFGNIAFENGQTGYGVRVSTEEARNAPFAVGDALWGITKIEIAKPGTQDKKTVQGEGLKPILAGFDLDAVPDASASFPRCLPSHSVTFKRGDGNVAFSSFLCGSGAPPPASLKAQFTAVHPAAPPDTAALASGGIEMDPRPIVKAFETQQ